MSEKKQSKRIPTLPQATGPLEYGLTNDYLFRALMQENNKALKGLVSSLLHLNPSKISSAVISNPITLGVSLGTKTFFLDVKVILNNHVSINLEMQVVNAGNWAERSLSYLCRSFDQLYKGQKYTAAKPVIHIGLLNFTLFPHYPEFYATYKLMNVKNHMIYSDKFRLSVLDLNQIHMATAEDQQHLIDQWAKLFKATTWEEIKMLATKNEYFREASQTLFQLSAEENIRLQCEAQEEFYRAQCFMEYQQQHTAQELLQTQNRLANAQSRLADTQDRLNHTQDRLNHTQDRLNHTESQLSDAQGRLNHTESQLSDAQGRLNHTESQLSDAQGRLNHTESQLSEAQVQIARLQAEIAALKENHRQQ